MNIETLILVNILISLEFALLMTAIWYSQKRNRILGYWVLAEWLVPIIFLFAQLFQSTDNMLWLSFSIVAIWLTFAAHLEALRLFSNTRPYAKYALIFGVLFSFLIGYMKIIGLNDGQRILLTSLSLMINSSLVILAVIYRKDQDGSTIYRLMIVVYALHFLYQLFRAAATTALGWLQGVPDELLMSSNYLELILFKMFSDMSIIGLIIQRMQSRLNYLAHHDDLTELPNRRFFVALAEREIADSRRKGKPCSVLMLDIDHFKNINDRFGHQAGDRTLFLFASWLRRSLRQHDVLARLGGEEFCVFLPDTDEKAAMEVAERLRAAVLANEVEWGTDHITITASIGLACYPKNGDEFRTLLQTADKALYQAKMLGRNTIVTSA